MTQSSVVFHNQGVKKIIFVSLMFMLSASAKADMSTFLKSCGYGTLAGAALGLASLAVSENPTGKINNVARGASLGLYAGIGYGAYLHYKQKNTPGSQDFSHNDPLLFFSPIVDRQSVQGVQAHFLVGRF